MKTMFEVEGKLVSKTKYKNKPGMYLILRCDTPEMLINSFGDVFQSIKIDVSSLKLMSWLSEIYEGDLIKIKGAIVTKNKTIISENKTNTKLLAISVSLVDDEYISDEKYLESLKIGEIKNCQGFSDDYYIFPNGNVYSREKFSLQDAESYYLTLSDCYGCIDCIKCINCNICVGLVGEVNQINKKE